MPPANWNAHVGALISALDTPDFPGVLRTVLHSIADYDFMVVFAYRGDARPLALFDDFPTDKRRVFVTDYQEGPYLLDPFFLTSKLSVEPRLYRLKELAPDRFYQSEYFRSYYVQTGLSEEIGFFVHIPDSVRIVVSLMRAKQSAVFGAKEMRALKATEPVILATVARHWRDLGQRFLQEPQAGEASDIQTQIENAFQTFGKSVLTPREREVVEFTLKGHSADAVGRILEISAGTVRIHRRNIYAKLRINSQGELFSQFIGALISG